MVSGRLLISFILVLAVQKCVQGHDYLDILTDKVESMTAMVRAFFVVFVGAFTINICAVIFIVFGDGRARKFLFPLVVVYALLYLVFTGISYLFLGLGNTVVSKIRLLGSALNEVSVSNVSDTAFEYIKVYEPDCKLRFVCEVSEKAVERDHMFALVLRIVTAVGSSGGPFVEAVLGGLSGRGCQVLFSSCEYSPLRRSLPFVD
ncbi:uncharacterized protein LOC135399978 [Ornithodoros turicata]|uniref:uncharacterized protein LOC135399978 n=1 Tax=Ornithodoros turicata TaxID=34597 RepID=UPI003138FD0E